MNDDARRSIIDRIKAELHGALLPILIALLAWMGSEKLNSIEGEIRQFREWTQELAVLQTQINERQETARMDRDKLGRMQQHLNAVDMRLQRQESSQERILETLRDHERRLNRASGEK